MTAFIEEHRDRPFCLYLPHEAPHYPYQGPNDQPIRIKGDPGNVTGERTDIPNAYREMIVEVDKGVGEIVGTLQKLGLAEKTLVIFCSDNGATPNGSNGGLRGFKGQAWEGGHRVPAIASWPGKIAPGTESDTTCLSMDIFPTLLDAAGIATPEGSAKLDGISLLPVLTQQGRVGDRTLFWETGGGTAVRRGPWKLVIDRPKKKKEFQAPEAPQLFDLSTDLGEKAPVDNPEVRAELEAALEAWRASWAGVPQRS